MNRWTAILATAFGFGLRRNPLGLIAALAVRERSAPMHYPPNRPDIPIDVSWAGYWQALQECDAWWKRSPAAFSIFPPGHSWVGMIRTLQPLHESGLVPPQRRGNRSVFSDAPPGIDDNWALLGQIRGFARKRCLRRAPPLAAESRPSSRKCHLCRRCRLPRNRHLLRTAASRHLHGIKHRSCASRLLTLACPDRCVSLNSASEQVLATYATKAPTTRPLVLALRRELSTESCCDASTRQPWFATTRIRIR